MKFLKIKPTYKHGSLLDTTQNYLLNIIRWNMKINKKIYDTNVVIIKQKFRIYVLEFNFKTDCCLNEYK